MKSISSHNERVESSITRCEVMPNYKREGIKPSRIGVVLPEELKSRLQNEAKLRGWSISQTAAFAIQEWLKSLETTAE